MLNILKWLRSLFIVAFSSTLLFSAFGVFAGSASSPGDEFGINGVGWFHYQDAPDGEAQAQRRFDDLRDLGATRDRLDFWWSIIEPERGRFDWTFPDRVIALYSKNGVQPLPILSYASAWSKGVSPADDAERERFGRYVEAVVRRYKDRVRAWEVWNEPNIPTFWTPKPSATDYAALLKVAYRAAKRADPTCLVVGGATSMADINYLKEVVRDGGWPYLDVLSIHPYSMAGGPTTQRLDLILEAVNRFDRSTGSPKPVWITEMGWTSLGGEEERAQSRYLLESYALAKAHGVERLFWFNLQDWSEKWGLTRTDSSRKLSFAAYRTAKKYLSGASFAGYLKDAPDWRRYEIAFEKGGKPILILWSEADATRPKWVSLPNRPSAILDPAGQSKPDRWRAGKLRIDETPVIVVGEPPSIRRRLASTRPLKRDQNLLSNPEFQGEASPRSWNRGRHEGTGKTGMFERVRRDGKTWLEMRRTDDAAWDHEPIPVEPGQKYRLEATAEAEGATGESMASIYWWNAVGWGYMGQADSKRIAGATAPGHPVKLTVEAVAPEGAYYLRVNFVSRKNDGTVRFTNPKLTRTR